ncbi:TrmH family RNA methyltransferase [uncultured Desulfobacter sp.]|uniref:TrmH family RNA methyltransferase n=1 Tax=uncultured Desulfobacter sp. TaxID=240139 RepID=UPI0029F5BA65|nr:TrmH family RNA methyltransferase [uncultured Desulfobacter sp.]
MGSYKARMIIKKAKEEAKCQFRRHRNKNRLATPGIHRCIIVLDGLKPSFNIGKIFRSAEAFGCHEVHLIGTDFFDPAPARGAFKHVPAKFHSRFISCYAELLERGYTPFILEPGLGEPVMDADLPEKSAFVFGHEEFGISFEPDLFPEVERLTIPQYGRCQSLNVSVAASIILYEYTRQYACRNLDPQAPPPCKERV